MTSDEEIVLRELAAGRFVAGDMVATLGTMSLWSKNSLAREIEKAVSAERERCAQICESFASVEGIAQKCAEAIRANVP